METGFAEGTTIALMRVVAVRDLTEDEALQLCEEIDNMLDHFLSKGGAAVRVYFEN